jgi:threonine/homoserine/homoserine lactone efflux protein
MAPPGRNPVPIIDLMETQLIAPVIGVLVAAAITPGPNNFLALEAGSRGVRAIARVVFGVVAGSLCLLALIAAGVGRLLVAHAWFGAALLVAGGAYLAWVGVMLIVHAGKDANERRDTHAAGAPSTLLGVAAFQLANPKAWMLVGSVAAASLADSFIQNLVAVGALIALVSAVCLGLWAFAGAMFAGWLARSRVRQWFDRAMGVLLTCSAAGMTIAVFQAR